MPKTLFEKIWDSHVVAQPPDSPAVLYIDLHLVHEVTSPQAFTSLREHGLKVRRPDKTVATMDHSIPTHSPSLPITDPLAAAQIRQMETNASEFGLRLYSMNSPQRGIVHVIGPELGFTQPGMTIVCGDSHTATHGAFGSLAFGIGTSEVEHVLATQCLLQRKPKTCEVRVEGHLPKGVTAKDIILALIAQIGVGGGTGHVFEYTGSAILAMSMEERMTVCNMSIEGGARAGMIAPDDTTFEYMHGREFAPQAAAWDKAVARWKMLHSDAGAVYDQTFILNATELEPMITFGTNPGMGIKINRIGTGSGSGNRSLSKGCLGKSSFLHGTPARIAITRKESGCRFHWQLHEWTHYRLTPGSRVNERSKCGGRNPCAGCARFSRSEKTR